DLQHSVDEGAVRFGALLAGVGGAVAFPIDRGGDRGLEAKRPRDAHKRIVGIRPIYADDLTGTLVASDTSAGYIANEAMPATGLREARGGAVFLIKQAKVRVSGRKQPLARQYEGHPTGVD